MTAVFCLVASSSSGQEWAREMFAETKHETPIRVVQLAFKAKQTPGRLEKTIHIETDYQGQNVVVTVLAVIATKESDEKGQRVSP